MQLSPRPKRIANADRNFPVYNQNLNPNFNNYDRLLVFAVREKKKNIAKMAATAISATHPILVTRVNYKLSSPNSIDFTNRAFLPVSISLKPLRAVLSSSAVSTEELAAGAGNNSLTLRELCQGHVPEHVLRRRVSETTHSF